MGPTGATWWDRCARARAKPHLDETNCFNSVRHILAKSKERVGQANSMGPTRSTWLDQCARARENSHLSETDCLNSVRPISAKSKQRVGQANSVGPIAQFGETKMLQRETESLQGHIGETEIRIGVTGVLDFLAMAISTELGGAG